MLHETIVRTITHKQRITNFYVTGCDHSKEILAMIIARIYSFSQSRSDHIVSVETTKKWGSISLKIACILQKPHPT